VTDANLMLGKVQPEHFPHVFGPNADQPLDREIVVRRFNEMAQSIASATGQSMTPEQLAQGFIDIANANMAAIYMNRGLYAYVIEEQQPEMDKIKATVIDARHAVAKIVEHQLAPGAVDHISPIGDSTAHRIIRLQNATDAQAERLIERRKTHRIALDKIVVDAGHMNRRAIESLRGGGQGEGERLALAGCKLSQAAIEHGRCRLDLRRIRIKAQRAPGGHAGQCQGIESGQAATGRARAQGIERLAGIVDGLCPAQHGECGPSAATPIERTEAIAPGIGESTAQMRGAHRIKPPDRPGCQAT
jgi:hypothetical protein